MLKRFKIFLIFNLLKLKFQYRKCNKHILADYCPWSLENLLLLITLFYGTSKSIYRHFELFLHLFSTNKPFCLLFIIANTSNYSSKDVVNSEPFLKLALGYFVVSRILPLEATLPSDICDLLL